MNKRRWIKRSTAVLAVVLVAGLGYGGYNAWQGRKAAGGTALAEARAEETALAERRTLRLTASGTGSLTPAEDVSLAFTVGGRVADVLVAEGERVTTGQTLAQLASDDLELKVAQAEAALTAAEAQLAQLVAAPRPEQVTVHEANLGAAQAQVNAAAARRDRAIAGADAGQIAAAEAQVASAITQRKQAYDWHETTMECIDIDKAFTLPDGSKEHIEKTVCPLLGPMEEKARYSWHAAEDALAAAQSRLDELESGADVDAIEAAQANVAAMAAQRDAAQARLAQLLAAPTVEEVEVQQAAVDEARAALDEARKRLMKATLTAPFCGTVTYLDVERGELVGANYPIVALSDLSTLEVDINVDETDAARVRMGQAARVTLDAFPDAELAGEVTRLAPVGEVTSGIVLYPVTVRLETGPSTGQAPPARAGMTADVEIVVGSEEDVLVVPLRAVHTEGERVYVERLVDGRLERVPVTLGMMTETEVEIADGGDGASLAEGDVVIVVAGSDETQRRGPLSLFGGGS